MARLPLSLIVCLSLALPLFSADKPAQSGKTRNKNKAVRSVEEAGGAAKIVVRQRKATKSSSKTKPVKKRVKTVFYVVVRVG